MKAQISRDGFKEEKQYSAVYQQQGRMLTDADWNEMVRILKQRMDRTVGAAIESGSPREGGILCKDVIAWEWDSPKEPFMVAEQLKWGRIYVDGMYGEMRSSKSEAPPEQAVKEFIEQQRDFPGNPVSHLEQGRYYVAYIDLWERLVVALEDEQLLDTALHGADTCVRTQTMSQLKLGRLEALKAEEAVAEVTANWEPKEKFPLLPHGTATLINPDSGSVTLAVSAAHDCNSATSNSEEFTHKNALFRLEVHESSAKKVVLKWSAENGAEQHSNETASDFPDIPTFFEKKYIYECYSDETEKHLGQHLLEGDNGWNSKKANLYTYNGYKSARGVAGSPAKEMPYVRRWDGYVTLKWLKAESRWEVDESESSFGLDVNISLKVNRSGNIKQSLTLEHTELKYKLELSTVQEESSKFMSGDFWLVLLRDNGATLSAEVLSAEPVGIHHHYLVLGVYKNIESFAGGPGRPGSPPDTPSVAGGPGRPGSPPDTPPVAGGPGTHPPPSAPPVGIYVSGITGSLLLTPQQWRRLSFPSLTNLTLDRVLVTDEHGSEISVEDKFVDVAGDTMTGDLSVQGKVGIGTIPSNSSGTLEVNGSIKLKNGESIDKFSKDGQLSNASNSSVPTENAVKEYVDTADNSLSESIIQDRRQFVPLLAFTLKGVEYKNGRNALIPVGKDPRGVAFDGTYIWACSRGSQTISKVDVTSNNIKATISVGYKPTAVAFGSTHIWVCNSGDDTISKIDVTADVVVATIRTGRYPYGVAFDGAHVWVSNYDGNTVSKIDVTTDVVVATIPVGYSPYGVVFDGSHIWVSNHDDYTVSKIDVTANSVVATIGVGRGPYGVAFDGTHIWVCNYSDDTISKIDVTANSVVTTINAGNNPFEVAFDGTHIWLSNFSYYALSKVDVMAESVVATMPISGSPRGVAFDGTHVWVGTQILVNNQSKGAISKILI